VKTSYQLSYFGSVSDTHNPTEGTVEAIEALLPGNLKKEQIKAG